MTEQSKPVNEDISWSCITVNDKAPAGNPDLGYGVSCYGMMEQHRRIKEALDAKDSQYTVRIRQLEKWLSDAGDVVGGSDLDCVASAFKKEIEKQKAEIERLAWNLAGCSTYALGYDLKEGHNKEMALPALEDVLKMALKNRDYQTVLEKVKEAFEKIIKCTESQIPLSTATACFTIAKEAIQLLNGLGEKKQ